MKVMFVLRVLMVLGGPMSYGGTEFFLMNYYRNINRDRVQFDFACQGDGPGVFDDEITEMGGKIFYLPYKTKHPFKYTSKLKKIMIENNYKAVHSQMDAMGCWPLAVAKSAGITMRIAHSHNTKCQTKNPVKKIMNNFAKIFTRKLATHHFACGYDAGVFLFGRKMMEQHKVQIIHNAIELNKYAFSMKKRERLRRKFGIGKEIVIGHVGQFREQKNHKKIIEIFTYITKTDSNIKLMLVGDGSLKSEIERIAEENNLKEKIIFTGARNDVSDLLNVFDVFLFPSLFEGLSVVAVEVQANGLPMVISDTIADETIITDTIIKVGLEKDASVWKEAVYKSLKFGRKDEMDKLIEAGYDIMTEASRLEEKYVNG